MSRRTGADPLGPACGPPTIDAIIEFWSLEVSKVLKMPTRRAVRGNAAFGSISERELQRTVAGVHQDGDGVVSLSCVARETFAPTTPLQPAGSCRCLAGTRRAHAAATSSNQQHELRAGRSISARRGETARRRDGARPKDSNRAAWPHPLHWTKPVARSRGRKNCSLCASTVHQESWQALPELKLAAGREGLGVQS